MRLSFQKNYQNYWRGSQEPSNSLTFRRWISFPEIHFNPEVAILKQRGSLLITTSSFSSFSHNNPNVNALVFRISCLIASVCPGRRHEKHTLCFPYLHLYLNLVLAFHCSILKICSSFTRSTMSISSHDMQRGKTYILKRKTYVLKPHAASLNANRDIKEI